MESCVLRLAGVPVLSGFKSCYTDDPVGSEQSPGAMAAFLLPDLFGPSLLAKVEACNSRNNELHSAN